MHIKTELFLRERELSKYRSRNTKLRTKGINIDFCKNNTQNNFNAALLDNLTSRMTVLELQLIKLDNVTFRNKVLELDS